MEGLDGLPTEAVEEAFHFYLPLTRELPHTAREAVALAAGLVELGLHRQRLGRSASSPLDLLVADLCLARAARLLAAAAGRSLLVAIAGVIELAAAAAAARTPPPDLRAELRGALEAAR